MRIHPSTTGFCSVHLSPVFRVLFFRVEVSEFPPDPVPDDPPAWVRGDLGWVPGPGFGEGSFDPPMLCDFCLGRGCDLCVGSGGLP